MLGGLDVRFVYIYDGPLCAEWRAKRCNKMTMMINDDDDMWRGLPHLDGACNFEARETVQGSMLLCGGGDWGAGVSG